jgi:hypothetical protein
MQIGRREHYKWGDSSKRFLAELKTREIKTIDRTVRRLIAEFAVFSAGDDEVSPRLIAFEECECDLVLEWDYPEEIWVLDLTQSPRRDRQRRRSAGAGDVGEGGSRAAAPEQARRHRKRVMPKD